MEKRTKKGFTKPIPGGRVSIFISQFISSFKGWLPLVRFQVSQGTRLGVLSRSLLKKPTAGPVVDLTPRLTAARQRNFMCKLQQIVGKKVDKPFKSHK